MGFIFWNSGEVVSQAGCEQCGLKATMPPVATICEQCGLKGQDQVPNKTEYKKQSKHSPVQFSLKRTWNGTWSQNKKYFIFAKRFDMKSMGFRSGVGFGISGERSSLTWQGLGTYNAA
jgi:hypothetical protein